MSNSDAIVRPVCNARTPNLGPTALMVSSKEDLGPLRDRLALPNERPLYMSQACYHAQDKQALTLVGPIMGASYAAMLLEILHAWGVQQVIFLGWCGSINSKVRTGDVIVPSGALIDEGTSLHYNQTTGGCVHPDSDLSRCLKRVLIEKQIPFQEGLVWTTDGVFRETRAKVEAFQKLKALAVEMEFSALLSVAAFQSMAIAGLLIASDELFSYRWQPGFKDPAFRTSRKLVTEVLLTISKAFQT
jgi:purine-nucleoside phosphorylase